eukprot:TRINITY_DN121394_c0_g1_i1.p1 TRINITY_DN121394_c0_g1~~TRINITY_DN121394_c0_g1_i1.p1  ORF type:complete len:207 (-),score=35.86 TRINITY_DN121394_c0_g1_i1:143-763(-)
MSYSLQKSQSSPAMAASNNKFLSTLSQHELTDKEHTYLASVRPFIGNPGDASRIMSAHPMSSLRQGGHLITDISMKDIWRMRKSGNYPIPNSHSLVHSTEAAPAFRQTLSQTKSGAFPSDRPSGAREYDSWCSMQNINSKHTRSPFSPINKYKDNMVSSHSIGWYHETEWGEKLGHRPTHGIEESRVTKQYANFVATNVEACLRLC